MFSPNNCGKCPPPKRPHHALRLISCRVFSTRWTSGSKIFLAHFSQFSLSRLLSHLLGPTYCQSDQSLVKWGLGPTMSRFLNTHNPLSLFTHIQFSVTFVEKLFSGTLITLRLFHNVFLIKRYHDNQHLNSYRIYCEKIQLADDAICYSRMFSAGEKLVLRVTKIKSCFSIIFKTNCSILHVHNSL